MADSNRIFTAENGSAINPDVVSDWFRKFIKTTDLPPISIHSLRHTNATLQIAGGVPITTVAERLGHANETTTGKIYAHAIKSANEAAADTLQDLLNPGYKKNQA
ncbi:tyrosine-type recombinase/integrase [Clostridium minihomine]|uniref:tyrosine-type recombinase/integrase n=1 Tax=Clostridium minihomine TaxID=2045012 RepID=UPI0013EBB77E